MREPHYRSAASEKGGGASHHATIRRYGWGSKSCLLGDPNAAKAVSVSDTVPEQYLHKCNKNDLQIQLEGAPMHVFDLEPNLFRN
jgi:hypothetical protein